MKKHLLLLRLVSSFLILHFTFLISSAQWVSIPDTNFGTWLNTNGYSACMQGNNTTGWQMDTSCPAVVGATLIDCDNSNITDLTGIQYFNNLTVFACSYNQLTWLPVLPESLDWLRCSYNQLTSLPSLPGSLTGLNCYSNLLTSLPALPGSLTWLSCGVNQLNSIPELPDLLSDFHCENNPNLYCLPILKIIEYFSFDSTVITCLPNYPQGNISSNPPLSSVPVCGLFNANGCSVYWNLAGNVYHDANLNCVSDSSDAAVNNIKVGLWKDGNLVDEIITVPDGSYTLLTDTFGNYEMRVDTTGLPFHVSCPANNVLYDTLTATDTLHFDRNFAISCKPGFDLAAWSISGRFRPARISPVNIHAGYLNSFYGAHCAAGISGNVTIEITGPASYASPAPGALTPTTVSGSMITYQVPDFGNTDFTNSFNMMVQTDTTANIGDTICIAVAITSVAGDNVPTNNFQTHCFFVVASVDPNNKEVYPLSDVDANGERWLTYTVNFQNTGTDTAIHIYITDTLDADLDVSTFQLLAYSHQPLVQLKENTVRFNFPNIMLVDSNANEPLSHGYVQYKVKVKSSAPVGTVINNTAYIYFDFNAPVVTNTTTNTLALISDVSDIGHRTPDINIYPNPANTNVTLQLDKTFTGGTVTVSDVTGRKMAAVELTTNYYLLSTETFATGVYFVTVTGRDGRSATRKLVIQK